MKNKVFLLSILLSLYMTMQGQILKEDRNVLGKDEILKKAQSAFDNEDYWQAMALCNTNKRNYPKKNLPRENLYVYSEQCDSLLKKSCNIPAFQEIKQIRGLYHLTCHPKTDRQIEECKNPRQQLTDDLVEDNILCNANTRKSIKVNVNVVLTELSQAYRDERQINLRTSNASLAAITGVRSLWLRTPFYVTGERIGKPEAKSDNGWEIRNIPVVFNNGEEGKIILEFDGNGLITNIARVLPQQLFKPEKITDKGSYPLDDSIPLKTIHNFLNQFASAFGDKNIDFIEMVFDDYALIIHEKTTKIVYKTDKDGKKIRYRYTQKTKKDKKQYITDLREAFSNNEWLNVDFSNIKIYRSKRDTNIYGINFLQIWQSPSKFDESDCGWVYLEIDFDNLQEPSIWIKAWQSADTSEDERYWIGSFKRIKSV